MHIPYHTWLSKIHVSKSLQAQPVTFFSSIGYNTSKGWFL